MKISSELKEFAREVAAETVKTERAERRKERSAYQRTEARLYALPVMVKKVASDREELERLEEGGRMAECSKDLVRFSRGSHRISPEDKLEAVIGEMRATIAADEYEISTVQKALKEIEDEYYFQVIPGKYFDRRNDEELGEELHCDERTVRRHRSRLVSQLAVLLYGSEALE